MKTQKRIAAFAVTALFTVGLALTFSGCSEQTPFEVDKEDLINSTVNSSSIIHTNDGPIKLLQMDTQASTLDKGSAEENLFYAEQFMPAKKRDNIRLGNVYYGHSKVTFFRNSIPEDMTIQFQWLASSTFEGMLNNLEFGPHGTIFKVPVRVQLSYKRADLTGIDETELKVYYFNEDTDLWEFIGGEVDTENKIVIVYLDHFSRYAIGTE